MAGGTGGVAHAGGGVLVEALPGEIAVHFGHVHIVGAGRGHEAALHVGHAAFRRQHEQIDARAVFERLNRRPAGIAGGGANHR